MHRWLTNTGILCVALAALSAALAPGKPQASVRSAPLAAPTYLGMQSCAATACHGSVAEDPAGRLIHSDRIGRDEYRAWADRDPHARSLQTLQGSRALAMLSQLQIIVQDAKTAAWRVLPEKQDQYNNCLKCHALEPRPVENPRVLSGLESVSCESCHGAAGQWRETHYVRTWSRAAGGALGFVDTAQPEQLAQRCVQCHVGSDDREVNHDLIAAGHPVLKFELAAYRDLLPKHWNDARLRSQHVDYEHKLWQAGQQACGAAALELLAKRTKSPQWPEFAEFDCFVCHHDLAAANWNRAADAAPQAQTAWNTWYFPGAAPPEVAQLRESLSQNKFRLSPELSEQIAAAQKAWHTRPANLGDFDPALARRSWDRAAQAYLQLVARDQAYRDEAGKARRSLTSADQEVTRQLQQLRALLAFAPGRDGPGRPDETVAAIQQRQSQIQDLLSDLQPKLRQREAP